MEVIVLNAMNKTPVAMDQFDASFFDYEVFLTIYNSSLDILHADNRFAQNSSAAFSLKLDLNV